MGICELGKVYSQAAGIQQHGRTRRREVIHTRRWEPREASLRYAVLQQPEVLLCVWALSSSLEDD